MDQETRDGWAEAARASEAADVATKTAARKPRRFQEELPCLLTDEERLKVGDEIAKVDDEIRDLEAEKKSTADGFKARISLAKQRGADFTEMLRTRREVRPVECIETFIFATNTVQVTRVDTGEIVRERAMSRSERQVDLPLEVAEDDSEPDDGAEDADGGEVEAPAPKAKRTRKKSV